MDTSFWAVIRKTVITGVVAGFINVLLYFIGGAIVGGINIQLSPGAGYMVMPPFLPFVASLIPTLLAGLGLWLAARVLSATGIKIWQGAVVILTLLSLISPFTEQVQTTDAGIVLAMMHLVVGGLMLWIMTPRA